MLASFVGAFLVAFPPFTNAVAAGPWGYAACVTACEAGCVTSCVVAGPVCTLCFDKCFAVCTPACYSNHTKVVKQMPDMSQRDVLVSRVENGDRVRTMNEATGTFSWVDVVSNTKYVAENGFDFVHIETSSGQVLDITIDHVMVIASGVGQWSAEAGAMTKRAMQLVVGDVLITTNGPDPIVTIKPSLRHEKYNLVTNSGTVLVVSSEKGAQTLTPTICNVGSDLVNISSSVEESISFLQQIRHWRNALWYTYETT